MKIKRDVVLLGCFFSLISCGSSTDSTDGQVTGGGTSSCPTSNDFTPPSGKVTGGACTNATGGPCVGRLMSATSSDGLTFTKTLSVISDQADVPTLAQDSKGCVYLYYVGNNVGSSSDNQNKLAVAISGDNGTSWVYKNVTLSGFAGGSAAVDPTIEILPDGTFRMYLTWDPNNSGIPNTYYAEGTDGTTFTNEGVSFSVSGKQVLDPTAVLAGSTWYYWAGGQTTDANGNWFATSSDGKTFTASTYNSSTSGNFDISINGTYQNVANGISVGSSGARIYTFDRSSKGTGTHINSALTSDGGTTWTADSETRLTLDSSNGKESTQIHDPAVVKLANGNYLMVYSTNMP